MSFIDLRPYFQARMKTVDEDLREWEDGFNIENIPSTILNKSWHFKTGLFSNIGAQGHTAFKFTCPVTINVILKGYGQPKEAIDTALFLSDAIVKECTDVVHRLNQANIKNVLPDTVNIRELSQTNDNIVVLEMQFNCTVMIQK